MSQSQPTTPLIGDDAAPLDQAFLRSFCAQWHLAWNAQDYERVTAMCTDDIEWRDPASPQPGHGAPAIGRTMELLARAFPDYQLQEREPAYASSSEARAIVPWRCTGTMTGPLDPPGFAPTGQRIEFHGDHHWEFRNGLLCRCELHYDLHAIGVQIGAVPAQGGTGERLALMSMPAGERQRIMADALDAEDRTRERISQLLHDEVLQSLLAARQDLAEAERTGSAEDHPVTRAKAAVVEAIAELRNVVTALHPVTRLRGGLPEAIKASADLHARRGGFGLSLNIEPEASGVRDQLIVSLAQELLSNAAQHSGASHVAVTLRRTRDGDVVFEVADDGRGMEPGRPREALDGGHIGLASIAMRVEACGGCFHPDSSPGEGTRVRVTLPAGPSGAESRGIRRFVSLTRRPRPPEPRPPQDDPTGRGWRSGWA